ncbi:MAG: hypothetical protein ACQETE_09670 [Bacteroidota bacterium]
MDHLFLQGTYHALSDPEEIQHKWPQWGDKLQAQWYPIRIVIPRSIISGMLLISHYQGYWDRAFSEPDCRPRSNHD